MAFPFEVIPQGVAGLLQGCRRDVDRTVDLDDVLLVARVLLFAAGDRLVNDALQGDLTQADVPDIVHQGVVDYQVRELGPKKRNALVRLERYRLRDFGQGLGEGFRIADADAARQREMFEQTVNLILEFLPILRL